jgi:hypothetical protein
MIGSPKKRNNWKDNKIVLYRIYDETSIVRRITCSANAVPMVSYTKHLGKRGFGMTLRKNRKSHSLGMFRFAKNVGNVGASTVP